MADRTFKPGKRLKIPDRVRKREKQLAGPMSSARDKLGKVGEKMPIQPANENISTNTFVGALGTYLTYAIEDYLPVRLGATVSITEGKRLSEDKYEYTIDVNAPLESQARFKALITSGTGVVSLWVDTFEITEFEKIRTRPARDTYRYKVVLKEN